MGSEIYSSRRQDNIKRKTRKFLQLAHQLDKELDKSTELFFKDRPFLEDPTLEPVIKEEHTDEEIEEKITNEYTIENLIKEIQALS